MVKYAILVINVEFSAFTVAVKWQSAILVSFQKIH